MKLLPNETVQMESDNKEIVLTTHRVWQETKSFGKLDIKCILLEDVCYCGYGKKSKLLLLILGIFAIIIGLGGFVAAGSGGNNESAACALTFLVGCIFTVWYLSTIRKGIIVASASGSIVMNVKGMKNENILAFIEKLIERKNERFLQVK